MKLREIKSCSDCPNMIMTFYNSTDYKCHKIDKTIPDIYDIPSWCPLPDIFKIGDRVQDEDGHIGYVGIFYDDGDFCTIENDAAHPNPKKIKENER